MAFYTWFYGSVDLSRAMWLVSIGFHAFISDKMPLKWKSNESESGLCDYVWMALRGLRLLLSVDDTNQLIRVESPLQRPRTLGGAHNLDLLALTTGSPNLPHSHPLVSHVQWHVPENKQPQLSHNNENRICVLSPIHCAHSLFIET